MKDPLENRLSQMPLRRAPAHWKNTIVQKAHPAPETCPQSPDRRISANWLALAAAWSLIALLQWDSNRGNSPGTDSLPGGFYIPSLSAFRTPEAFLEELLAEPRSLPPGPKHSRYTAHKAAIIA
ncbi:MAG: hypothetical protein DVB28_001813 [Verrucomicrobia bacterium]|nr:MAG: hypothetical protein DVB28_001813 [Verrucomicrobiota bacterium]